MFTGQLGTKDSQFGWIAFGHGPAVGTVVVVGRAESDDTARVAEAQPTVLKLT